MRRCVTSLAIKEMKIKVMRGYFILIRLAKLKNLMIPRNGEDMRHHKLMSL